jgi:hypothetical protein
MRINQPEDRILEPRLQAIERSMPQLAGQQDSKDPAGAQRPVKAADGANLRRSRMLLSQRGLGHPNAEPVRNRT